MLLAAKLRLRGEFIQPHSCKSPGSGAGVTASIHRTDTVDYAVVLQGSITMLLDEQDVELSAGDVVVQNGTSHAWANRGRAPCLVAFVLVDASGDLPP